MMTTVVSSGQSATSQPVTSGDGLTVFGTAARSTVSGGDFAKTFRESVFPKALKRQRNFTFLCHGTAVLALMAFGTVSAAPEKVLHSFTNGADGGDPEAGLLLVDGALYGTTREGGSHKMGTAFVLTPPAKGKTAWTEKVLHPFGAGADGSMPYGGLVRASDGVLYGTTPYGGSHQCGVVYSLAPPATGAAWKETVLHSFCANKVDGSGPFAQVTLDGMVVYGTTNSGGQAGEGAIFRLKAPAKTGAWTETILHSFASTVKDGISPYSGLTLNDGAFIGTTTGGGQGGTVYSLTAPAKGKTAWTEDAIHIFGSTKNDGSYAYAGVVRAPSGVLYGTTRDGGTHNFGTVYSLTPPAKGKTVWTQTILHDFTNASDGGNPYSGLVVDSTGALYGTTYGGGTQSSGVVYKLTPPAKGKAAWTETVLHAFTGNADGGYPAAGLVRAKSGELYGTTLAGGAHNFGTVFEVTP
jgi:uncharacterized repeat protein (TIGR03803 family)